jgi:RNA polymerase sigma-70 factor (ECF subfamily)
MDDLAHPRERELRTLMTASLDGDANAYHLLLERLTGHLRAYYRHRFARIGTVLQKQKTCYRRH